MRRYIPQLWKTTGIFFSKLLRFLTESDLRLIGVIGCCISTWKVYAYNVFSKYQLMHILFLKICVLNRKWQKNGSIKVKRLF